MAPKDTRQLPPEHVAIIMDGNGRWATQRGLPRLQGHRAGARRVRDIVKACPDYGVRYLTLFAFSTENWKRTQEEVSGLMALFRRYIKSEAKELITKGVRVRFIGDRSPLDKRLVALMDSLEKDTAKNDSLHLTVALNYGGRDEITRAGLAMAKAIADGNLDAAHVTPEVMGAFMDTGHLPDPDLVIRTSGETRISNFLLWQSAYAEYEFSHVLWPDFSADRFAEILMTFGGRERRFGAVVS